MNATRTRGAFVQTFNPEHAKAQQFYLCIIEAELIFNVQSWAGTAALHLIRRRKGSFPPCRVSGGWTVAGGWAGR
jgi:hypothetical protein